MCVIRIDSNNMDQANDSRFLHNGWCSNGNLLMADTLENVIAPTVSREILDMLRKAETEQNTKIIYACESGSRAWGFASPDSNYDVRFIYIRPSEWYLSFDVERQRDVIEYPLINEIDYCGWGIRKDTLFVH